MFLELGCGRSFEIPSLERGQCFYDLVWAVGGANAFLELGCGGSFKISSLERGRSCTILDLRRVLRFRIEAAPSDERRCKKYTQNS